MVFDFTAFFPGHVRSSIGRSVADRRTALERCINALGQYPQVPDSSAWKSKLDELLSQFSATTGSSSASISTKRQDEQSFAKLRRRWRRHYLACKRGMESVLIVEDRESELMGLFLDLQKGKGKVASGAATGGTGDTGTATAEASEGDPEGTSSGGADTNMPG